MPRRLNHPREVTTERSEKVTTRANVEANRPRVDAAVPDVAVPDVAVLPVADLADLAADLLDEVNVPTPAADVHPHVPMQIPATTIRQVPADRVLVVDQAADAADQVPTVDRAADAADQVPTADRAGVTGRIIATQRRRVVAPRTTVLLRDNPRRRDHPQNEAAEVATKTPRVADRNPKAETQNGVARVVRPKHSTDRIIIEALIAPAVGVFSFS